MHLNNKLHMKVMSYACGNFVRKYVVWSVDRWWIPWGTAFCCSW